MPQFNLQDYEPVEERLARFWKDHPSGRIRTEIVASDDKTIVMSALIFRDAGDSLAAANGHAQETPGAGMVNKTSWVENCETSAIGRALANLGYAPKGARASREEMQKATRPTPPPPPPAEDDSAKLTTRTQQQRIVITASDHDIDDELRHRITRMVCGVTSSKQVKRGDVNRLLKSFEAFGQRRDTATKKLEQWEAENITSTAAQWLREGPPNLRARDRAASPSGHASPAGPDGEHTLTPKELEGAGQTRLDAPVEPA